MDIANGDIARANIYSCGHAPSRTSLSLRAFLLAKINDLKDKYDYS
jgi:hypothetical protein